MSANKDDHRYFPHRSYRQLQQIAKSYNIPGNVKRQILEEAIIFHEEGRMEDKNALLEEYKKERYKKKISDVNYVTSTTVTKNVKKHKSAPSYIGKTVRPHPVKPPVVSIPSRPRLSLPHVDYTGLARDHRTYGRQITATEQHAIVQQFFNRCCAQGSHYACTEPFLSSDPYARMPMINLHHHRKVTNSSYLRNGNIQSRDSAFSLVNQNLPVKYEYNAYEEHTLVIPSQNCNYAENLSHDAANVSVTNSFDSAAYIHQLSANQIREFITCTPTLTTTTETVTSPNNSQIVFDCPSHLLPNVPQLSTGSVTNVSMTNMKPISDTDPEVENDNSVAIVATSLSSSETNKSDIIGSRYGPNTVNMASNLECLLNLKTDHSQPPNLYLPAFGKHMDTSLRTCYQNPVCSITSCDILSSRLNSNVENTENSTNDTASTNDSFSSIITAEIEDSGASLSPTQQITDQKSEGWRPPSLNLFDNIDLANSNVSVESFLSELQETGQGQVLPSFSYFTELLENPALYQSTTSGVVQFTQSGATASTPFTDYANMHFCNPAVNVQSCAYRNSGCRELLQLSNLSAHEYNCLFRPVYCPIYNCPYQCSMVHLHHHIHQHHSDEIKYSDDYLHNFSVEELQRQQCLVFIQEHARTTYILKVIKCEEQDMIATVQYVPVVDCEWQRTIPIFGRLEFHFGMNESRTWTGVIRPYNMVLTDVDSSADFLLFSKPRCCYLALRFRINCP